MPDWPISDKLSVLSGRVAGLAAAVPLDKLRHGFLLLISVWILSMLADVFWHLMPEPSAGVPSAMLASYSPATTTRRDARQAQEKLAVDVETMQSWHLFGKAEEVQVQEPVDTMATLPDEAELDAKETRLQLKLLGIMQSNIAGRGHAIIEHASDAGLYRVGDTVPGGRNVTLSRVLQDRVIIDNRGTPEALILYDQEERQSRAAPPPRQTPATRAQSRVLDRRDDSRLTEVASQYRQQLMSNPMSLADVIRVSIARDNSGNVLGYSIRPGRDREQFAQFGLQSGDIVTEVNGVPLDDPAQAMQLYRQLGDATEASLKILRGSEEINVIVGLSE